MPNQLVPGSPPRTLPSRRPKQRERVGCKRTAAQRSESRSLRPTLLMRRRTSQWHNVEMERTRTQFAQPRRRRSSPTSNLPQRLLRPPAKRSASMWRCLGLAPPHTQGAPINRRTSEYARVQDVTPPTVVQTVVEGTDDDDDDDDDGGKVKINHVGTFDVEVFAPVVSVLWLYRPLHILQGGSRGVSIGHRPC